MLLKVKLFIKGDWMKVIKTKIPGVFIVEPKVFGDSRGWFVETYNKMKFEEHNIDVEFIQDNHSYSKEKGTLRGIHFQVGEFAQTKLVRCTKGSVLDIAVDLRKDSTTFKEWVGVILSAQNRKQLFIPKGFGHAFLTLENDVEFQYKVDNYYSSANDKSLKWNDENIAIDWGIKNPILSRKDKVAPTLKDIGELF